MAQTLFSPPPSLCCRSWPLGSSLSNLFTDKSAWWLGWVRGVGFLGVHAGWHAGGPRLAVKLQPLQTELFLISSVCSVSATSYRQFSVASSNSPRQQSTTTASFRWHKTDSDGAVFCATLGFRHVGGCGTRVLNCHHHSEVRVESQAWRRSERAEEGEECWF